MWPANEEFFNFRVLHPAPGEAAEGAMKIGVKTRVNKRWEYTYGTYKFIRVQDGSESATYRSDSADPAALTTVRKLVPAFHGRFDSADMVRGIADSTVDDRAARCIDFDTLKGDQHPAEYFDYPADAKIDNGCREFHRAFADRTPQPEPKTQSNEAIAVRVHGRVGKDGKPTALKVLDAPRPDLGEEALRVVSNWSFHPAMCVYEPANQEMDFEVVFGCLTVLGIAAWDHAVGFGWE